MLAALKRLMVTLGPEGRPPRFADGDYRVAAAALLIHTSMIDGGMSAVEREKLMAVLKRGFDLDDAAVTDLVSAASEVEREAIDLYRFTSRLNHALDDDGRRQMIGMMWDVVYADGDATEFESNLVWRAADLLGISREERIALRQRAKAARKGDIQ